MLSIRGRLLLRITSTSVSSEMATNQGHSGQVSVNWEADVVHQLDHKISSFGEDVMIQRLLRHADSPVRI